VAATLARTKSLLVVPIGYARPAGAHTHESCTAAAAAPGGGTSAKACASVRTKSQRASSHSQSTVVARSSAVCRIETRVAPGALAFATTADVCASGKRHVLADGSDDCG